MENTYVSFFESGRVVVTQPDKPILVFKNQSGLVAEIESFGFDADEVSKAMGAAGEMHDGIAWDLIPAANCPLEIKNESTGNHLFTDRGNRVTFDKVRVTDEEIRLALVHAEQKFGGRITLTGDDPAFTERMARLADDMGITVLNPELQPIIAAHRDLLAQSAPSFAPPMMLAKKGFWRRFLSWKK